MLLIFLVNREGYTALRANGWMSLFNGKLDILWVEIAPIDNDQVFEAARNKEVSSLKHSQIAGLQKGTFARRQVSLEGASGLLWALPVTTGHAGTRDPDFAYLTISTGLTGLGIDDDNAQAAARLSTTNQWMRILVLFASRHHNVLIQAVFMDRLNKHGLTATA